MLKLKDLARINPWWKFRKEFYLHDRDLGKAEFLIERKLPEIRVGNVYIIRGIRRSGKTFLIKLMIKRLLEKGVEPLSILYVSCDRLSSRWELLRIIEEFLELNVAKEKVFIFLDEITYLPDWFLAVKNLAELDEIDRVCLVATGSSPVAIKEKSERLPGRRVEGNEHYVRPLSFREFILYIPSSKFPIKKEEVEAIKRAIRSTKIDIENIKHSDFKEIFGFADTLYKLLRIYMITGGFPEAIVCYLTKGKIDDKVYEEIIRLILGDVSKTGRSESAALGLLRYVADNLAYRTDFLTIAKELDRHPETIKEIVEILESSFVMMTLYCWDADKKVPNRRKQKKLVFTDPFIFSSVKKYVYGLDFDDILLEIEKQESQIAEMLVASAIAASKEVPLMREWWSFLGFYYDQTKEVDVVYFGKKTVGFEVKMSEKIKRKRYPFDVFYITKDEFRERMIPIYLFLAGIEKSVRTL